jgi:hypothetical protein
MSEDNKLELKHLACYLPYGLKMSDSKGSIFYLSTTSNMLGEGIEGRDIHTCFQYYKPILRPIEDLYNEETDCGIKIVHYFNFRTSVKLDCRNFPYHVMEQLFKNHFDVFGLIDKGLAISYNDLTEKVIREPN